MSTPARLAAASSEAAASASSISTVSPQKPLGKRLYRWVKKVHMYVGLLIYVQLTVYGIAGLTATFEEAPAHREPFPSSLSSLEYHPPEGASDKQIADDIHALLDPPLAGPVPEWALARTSEGHLRVNFYSMNGPTHVTVLPDEGQLQIERVRNSFTRFLSNAHATTHRDDTGDPRLVLWATMNEIGIWSLLFLALSGLYLWLASRPRLRLAIGSFAGGLAAFLLLWFVIR